MEGSFDPPMPAPAARPDRDDPEYIEWLIDEAGRGSFPASDPSSIAQPHRSRR